MKRYSMNYHDKLFRKTYIHKEVNHITIVKNSNNTEVIPQDPQCLNFLIVDNLYKFINLSNRINHTIDEKKNIE